MVSYSKIKEEQRRTAVGTVDNLFIDGMVCQDAERGKRNLNMALVDVAEAYDSVDDG